MALTKLKSLIFPANEEDYYEEEVPTQESNYQQPAQPTPKAARSRMSAMSAANPSSKIALFEPKVYSDSRAIASQVLGGEAVIVNFTSIDDTQAKRILDFLGGAVYAVNGEIERIGKAIFLVAPNTFEISGTLTDDIDASARY